MKMPISCLVALFALVASANYRPEGGSIVCVNGTNRFTRALYGSCAQSRVETSDTPEMSLYLSRHEAYTMEFPGLQKEKPVKAIFEKGLRNYEFPKLGLKASIAAFAKGDGGVIRFDGTDLKAPYAIEYIEGPMSAKKFFRDGDYGRDPSSAFFVRKDFRRNVKTLELKPGEVKYLVLTKPGDTARWGHRALPDSKGLVGTDVLIGPEQLYAEGAAYAAKVAGRLRIVTPDPELNALGPALALAENGAWDDSYGCYMHGAIGWRMPLNGWRGGYLADLLGDHARARILFDSYLASMVTNVPCTKPHQQDAQKNYARAKEVWGSPMYSNGYICRNPRNAKTMHHYDMNLVFIDQLLGHLRATGDGDYAKAVWPKIKLHLAWEKRVFDPDNDFLYDGYCCIWASDALQYDGGAVTHASAYNYFANRMAAEVAAWIGEDPKPFADEADGIAKAVKARLWIPEKGYWAEFADNMGRRMRHDAAAAWTEYTAIDCGLGTPEERYTAAKYMEYALPHHPVDGKYAVISTSCWQPYRWSVNVVAMAEIMHAALAHWEAGNDAEAWRIFKGIVLDSCYQGCGPGNFEQLSKYGAHTGECYRDFTDTTACTLRAIVRGLFGISPDLIKGEVRIRPAFPESWDYAELHTADIDYVYRKVDGKDTFDIKAHYPQPAKVIIEPRFKHPAFTPPEYGFGRGCARPSAASGCRPRLGSQSAGRNGVRPAPHIRYTPVDISSVTNGLACDLYAEGKYVTPAWPYTTLKMPASGLGDWCVPTAKAHKNNHEGDMKRKKAEGAREAGFKIASKVPVAFTSLYDNYPNEITVNVNGPVGTSVPVTVGPVIPNGPSSLRLELVAATYHMQYGVTNGLVTATYTDGSTTTFPLILPETLAPANARLVDTWQMPCKTAKRERGDLGNAWSDFVEMPVDPKKTLRSVTLETWSNETVIGLKSLFMIK